MYTPFIKVTALLTEFRRLADHKNAVRLDLQGDSSPIDTCLTSIKNFNKTDILMTANERRLLKSKEAAYYLQICERTLTKLSIPRVRHGRSVRYDIRDLDSYIENNKS